MVVLVIMVLEVVEESAVVLVATGADLGFLEWWGCKTNARENFRPRPLN